MKQTEINSKRQESTLRRVTLEGLSGRKNERTKYGALW